LLAVSGHGVGQNETVCTAAILRYRNVRALSYPPFCSLAKSADKGKRLAQNESRFLNAAEGIRVAMIKV
jgi:hypothetical protein